MTEIHVGVTVEEIDQSLASVTTGTDKSNLGGVVLVLVLDTKRRVGVSGGGVPTSGGDTKGAANTLHVARGERAGREGSGLLSEGLSVLLQSLGDILDSKSTRCGAVELALEVVVTEHLSTVLNELGHQLTDLLRGLNAVPEENFTLASNATVSLLREPSQVLVILLDGPSKLGVVVLQVLENVVGDVGEPCGTGHGQSGQVSQSAGRGSGIGGKDNSEGLHAFVVVSGESLALEAVKVAVYNGLGIKTLTIANKNLLELVHVRELGQRSSLVELGTTADKGSGTGVGEQLALKTLGVDDSHTGRAREVVKEVLDVSNLGTSAVDDPRHVHVAVVLLIEVDGLDKLAGVLVVQTTLLGEVDNLQRHECLGQLSSGLVGVDVEELTLVVLGHAGKDRNVVVGNGGVDGVGVDLVDLTDELPRVLVLVVGHEDTRGDGTSTNTPRLKSLDELQVLLEEQLARDAQRRSIGDTDSLAVLRLDSSFSEKLVHLGAGSVDDDGEQAHLVEVAQRAAEDIDVIGQDGTANLDNSELLRRNRLELREVLLHLA